MNKIMFFILLIFGNNSLYAFIADEISHVYVRAENNCNVNINNLNSNCLNNGLGLNCYEIIIEIPSFNNRQMNEISYVNFFNNNFSWSNSFGPWSPTPKNNTISMVGSDFNKIKEFPKNLTIRTYTTEFQVNRVIYDTQSFTKAENDFKACQDLAKELERQKEQPENRLRKFFGLKMK